MPDFVIKFVKDDNYRRFNLTGILTKNNRGIYALDLFEEAMPMMESFILDEDGQTQSKYEDGDLINHVHATVTIDPKNIPAIISSLQTLYDTYTESNSPQKTESGE